MSLETAAWAWRQKQVGPNGLLVLFALEERLYGKTCCWPSLKCISEDTGGLSRSTIRRTITDLQNAGLIMVFEVWTGAGKSSLTFVLNTHDMPMDYRWERWARTEATRARDGFLHPRDETRQLAREAFGRRTSVRQIGLPDPVDNPVENAGTPSTVEHAPSPVRHTPSSVEGIPSPVEHEEAT